jgi:putative tryptophan/tyrosine transport system substrate-binding protein
LARPGGNITGVTSLQRELSGKRLELLKELNPEISRVGAFVSSGQVSLGDFKPYEAPARALKLQLQLIEVRGLNPDIDAAFQAAAKGRANALITVSGNVLNRYTKRIADLAIKNRLPSMCERSEYVEAGCLVSYQPTMLISTGAPRITWTEFLKAPSLPTCPWSSRRSLSW